MKLKKNLLFIWSINSILILWNILFVIKLVSFVTSEQEKIYFHSKLIEYKIQLI
ncbi:hypothetical protein SD77_3029 [Bacillus badius]|uniref:Uncharacterized protein n=1 Tax=Bacillus badius TaxID=1455 RepID=A0ABR5ANZ2_BACBA|nr:hypothetical protein SD77_3029 [Bacillus badius]